MTKLIHGGQLTAIAKQFALEPSGWLDLSTGISPYSYPIKDQSFPLLNCLPEIDERFMECARAYFQVNNLLATHGSQAAIKALPLLWLMMNKVDLSKKLANKDHNMQVFLPKYGYREHEKAWRTFHYSAIYYEHINEITDLKSGDAIVVINPNNPTGEYLDKQCLHKLRIRAERKNCLLVVDEAFMDVMAVQHSLLSRDGFSHCIVLRSFGKFFGLAGLRLGFVNSSKQILARLDDLLGPWQVTDFTQKIAQQALQDRAWHSMQQQRLLSQSNRLYSLLTRYFVKEYVAVNSVTMTALFVSVRLADAERWFNCLAKQKIYVRLWDDKSGLRFGIPRLSDFARLENSLANVLKSL
ncbi:aminotransferase class I/II-fold pyridoxal phosphate-dependent enzyme [Aliikangiella sp. IMCC44632]